MTREHFSRLEKQRKKWYNRLTTVTVFSRLALLGGVLFFLYSIILQVFHLI